MFPCEVGFPEEIVPLPPMKSMLFTIRIICRQALIVYTLTGALEEAFLSLDDELRQERFDYHIKGGCTAVACVIIKGK